MPKDKKLVAVFLVSLFFLILTFFQFPKHAFLYGLIQSWFITKGLVIYRDFVDAYLPLLKLLSVPVHQILGFNQWVTIIASPVLSACILLVLYLLSKRWLRGISRFIPLLVFSIWNPYISGNQFTTTGFVGFVILLMIYFWLDWIDKKKNSSLFLIGLLGGTALFCLQIVAPFITLIIFSSILIINRDNNFLRKTLIVLLGALIPAVYVILWFFSRGALYDFFYWNFLYYFQGGYPYSDLGRDYNLVLIFFSLHAPILLSGILLFSKTKQSNFPPFTYLFFTLALFSLPLTFWFAVFHPMRFQISLPVFSFLFGFVWTSKSGLRQGLNKKIISVGVVAIIIFQIITLSTNVIPIYAKDISGKRANLVISKVYPNDPMYEAENWIKQNTMNEDTIFVIGDTLFYFDAKRLPANSRSTATEPIVYYPLESLTGELKIKAPEYWVIDDRMFTRFSNEWKMPEVTDYFKEILSCQKKVATFEYWSIYRQTTDKCF